MYGKNRMFLKISVEYFLIQCDRDKGGVIYDDYNLFICLLVLFIYVVDVNFLQVYYFYIFDDLDLK